MDSAHQRTDFFLKRWIVDWPLKAASLLLAVVIWSFVHHSITETKTFPNIPVRLINLPESTTAAGLLANGLLERRMVLTIQGGQEALEELHAADLEVIFDASQAEGDEWVVHATRKNLVSLDPSFDPQKAILSISHPEFIIHLSPLITAKIPVHVTAPEGTPPSDYDYLGVWPRRLWHEVSGPKEELERLQKEGLLLKFNLSMVDNHQLDLLKAAQTQSDAVHFPVPKQWQQLYVPLQGGMIELLNDAYGDRIQIDFLAKKPLLLLRSIPVQIFPNMSEGEAPELLPSELVEERDGRFFFAMPLFLHHVPALFLEVIEEHLQWTVTLGESKESSVSLDLIAAPLREKEYVARALELLPHDERDGEQRRDREQSLRGRFREYMTKLHPYNRKGAPVSFLVERKGHTLQLQALSVDE